MKILVHMKLPLMWRLSLVIKALITGLRFQMASFCKILIYKNT